VRDKQHPYALAIDIGGTKIATAVVGGDGALVCRMVTRTPVGQGAEAILSAAIALARQTYAEAWSSGLDVVAAGVGSAGHVDHRRGVITYASATLPGWSGLPLAERLEFSLGLPVVADNDVNAMAFGEHLLGAGRSFSDVLYLTVGTGIGGALLVDGKVVNGAAHAELGHVRLRRAAGDAAPSTCPYHPDCAEGLASGPAVQRRFGHTLSEATPDERALIGNYLGQLAAALVLVLSPQRIVIGGGVAKTAGLLDLARTGMLEELNGYAAYPELLAPDFLRPPALGEDAGLTGALFLAAMRERR
jgi:fructokinase